MPQGSHSTLARTATGSRDISINRKGRSAAFSQSTGSASSMQKGGLAAGAASANQVGGRDKCTRNLCCWRVGRLHLLPLEQARSANGPHVSQPLKSWPPPLPPMQANAYAGYGTAVTTAVGQAVALPQGGYGKTNAEVNTFGKVYVAPSPSPKPLHG